MNLSYREKSIMGSLAAILVGYGYYFAAIFRGSRPPELNGGSVALLISAVFVIVVIEVVSQIVIALASRVEPKDERDVLIERKAYRNAYILLIAGLFLWMGTVVLFGLTPYLSVNLVLLSVVVSETVKLLTQVFFYRRGF
jgi:hypothetical protein